MRQSLGEGGSVEAIQGHVPHAEDVHSDGKTPWIDSTGMNVHGNEKTEGKEDPTDSHKQTGIRYWDQSGFRAAILLLSSNPPHLKRHPSHLQMLTKALPSCCYLENHRQCPTQGRKEASRGRH